MMSIVYRFIAITAAVAVVAVLVWAPWKTPDTAMLLGADGEAIPDDGSFKPIADTNMTAPHELVRYYMPEAKDPPPLSDGVTDLTWENLWKDGEFKLNVEEEDRVGRPTAEQFPEGTTAEDVMMFFLDIADMRNFQPHKGEIRKELDGKRVRLAGYTTPVGFGEDEQRFLLVPELGACIHVPPPPPNQIVYVEKTEGSPEMFAPIWVTGTLRAKPVATVLADVGYQLVDVVAEPYK